MDSSGGYGQRPSWRYRRLMPERPQVTLESAVLPTGGDLPLTLHQGDRVVRSRPDGRIDPAERDGFFVADTRLISRWEWRLDGQRPVLQEGAAVSNGEAKLVLETGAGRLTLARTVDAGGATEVVTLQARPDKPLNATLELVLEMDFADVFEVRGMAPPRQREVETRWSAEKLELRATYGNGPFRRLLALGVDADTRPRPTQDGLEFDVTAGPAETCTVSLTMRPFSAGGPGRVLDRARTSALAPPEDPMVRKAWDRALVDLESLELEDPDPARGAIAPAAGIPWFACLFGRDSLICAIQAVSARPDLARGTLLRLAAVQATGDDPARDMEPGKIPHEVRIGELATLGLTPFGPYYGSHDATSLFLIALSETWRATGDDDFVRQLWPNALAAMRWIDEYGDRDGDGFQEYETRTGGGFRNQGWRDSPDATTGADGLDAPLPIALCEHQGYAFDAKVRMAELADRVMGDAVLGARLTDEADALRRRFDEAFWWEQEGTYALGLDGAKAQIRSVASNPGHCLWSGIVPEARAGRVVARLMRDDVFSGWGLRCLSAAHPTYNAFSYHVGSVWPHDTAIAASGFRRYGFEEAARRLERAVLEAAAAFPLARLPEVFSGLERQPDSPPVPLIATTTSRHASPGLLTEANAPQAWSASTVIAIVEAARTRHTSTEDRETV